MSRDKTTSPQYHGQFLNGTGPGAFGDERLAQIRDLLFGDERRLTSTKIAELEARLLELEIGVHQRIDALQLRFDAISAEVTQEHRKAFEELARGMSEIGARIRRPSQG